MTRSSVYVPAGDEMPLKQNDCRLLPFNKYTSRLLWRITSGFYKSYVYLFRIILENRCLPPDMTLRISSCRLSSNYVKLKCEFFWKKLESFSDEKDVLLRLAGKRCKDFPAYRQSSCICFPAFFLPLFIVSRGSVLVENHSLCSWKNIWKINKWEVVTWFC